MTLPKTGPQLRPSTASLDEQPLDRPSVHQLSQDATARGVPGNPRTGEPVPESPSRPEQADVPVQFKVPAYFRKALHTEAAEKSVTIRWILMKCVHEHPEFGITVRPEDLFEDGRKK